LQFREFAEGTAISQLNLKISFKKVNSTIENTINKKSTAVSAMKKKLKLQQQHLTHPRLQK
jgi:hypothetical protein